MTKQTFFVHNIFDKSTLESLLMSFEKDDVVKKPEQVLKNLI